VHPGFNSGAFWQYVVSWCVQNKEKIRYLMTMEEHFFQSNTLICRKEKGGCKCDFFGFVAVVMNM
jgi:hypothetical protein